MRRQLIENPMLMELRRKWRKFLGGNTRGATITMAVICFSCYLLLIGFLTSKAEGIAEYGGEVMHVVLLLLYSLIAPALVHTAIAGERERKTWDLLMVTPLTDAQIVIGKYITGIVALVIVLLPCIPPSLVFAIWSGKAADLVMPFTATAYGLLVAAFGLLMSSLTRTTIVALAATYGSLIIVLVFLPGVTAAALDYESGKGLLFLHPFMLLDDATVPHAMIQFFSYVAATAIALVVCVISLRGRITPKPRTRIGGNG